MSSPMKYGLVVAAWLGASATSSWAQVMVSANDGKVFLNNGITEYVPDGKDSVSVIDLSEGSPKIIAELAVPNSVLGPPSNVAISPDGTVALVASARKYAGDPPRPVSDDRLTFIDLRPLRLGGAPAAHAGDRAAIGDPTILATLEVGKGPSGVAINASGTLALVAHRDEGTVWLVSMARRQVISKLSVGDNMSGPSAIAFTPDGTRALVSLYGPRAAPNGTQVAVLRVHDDKVELTGRLITTGFGPFGLDVSQTGDIAVVANLGGGFTGDTDVVSVIDLHQEPMRVVSGISVAPSPEGVKLSPDGQFLAVSSVNGTHKPRDSAFYNDAGALQVYRRQGTSFHRVAEAQSGHWCQGVAWSKDATRIYLQCMVEKEIQVFSFEPGGPWGLKRMPPLKINSGPAGLAVLHN